MRAHTQRGRPDPIAEEMRERVYTEMLSAPLGESLDLDVYLPILQRHPDSRRKMGSGVRRIYVSERRDIVGRPRALTVERIDGSTDTFSWTACIGKLQPENRRRIEDKLNTRPPQRRPSHHARMVALLESIDARLERLEAALEDGDA